MNAERSSGIANSAIYAAVMAALKSNGARGKALDFGAGTGNLTSELLESRMFSQVRAVDLVDYGAPKDKLILWDYADLNVPLDFADAAFDTVVSSEVLEHLENPARLRANGRDCRGRGAVLSSPLQTTKAGVRCFRS